MLIFTDDCYNGGEPETDNLDEVKKIIRGYINAYAANKLIKQTNVPSPEYAVWSYKLAAAQGGGNDLLRLEAQERGITLGALISKIIAKADEFHNLEARISGIAGKHKDIVDAMTTREELVNYDWRFEV